MRRQGLMLVPARPVRLGSMGAAGSTQPAAPSVYPMTTSQIVTVVGMGVVGGLMLGMIMQPKLARARRRAKVAAAANQPALMGIGGTVLGAGMSSLITYMLMKANTK